MDKMALDGITIVDFGWAWAAPYMGRMLADMDARAIKIESLTRMDVIRSLIALEDGGTL